MVRSKEKYIEMTQNETKGGLVARGVEEKRKCGNTKPSEIDEFN